MTIHRLVQKRFHQAAEVTRFSKEWHQHTLYYFSNIIQKIRKKSNYFITIIYSRGVQPFVQEGQIPTTGWNRGPRF